MLSLIGLAPSSARAATFMTFNLGGNTSYDGWEGLTATNYPLYGNNIGFPPGNTAWPGPIVSNTAGSGDAFLARTSGTAYAGSASLYAFSPSSFIVGDNTPVSALQTLIFQIEINQAFQSGPVLNLNGGSQNLASTYQANLGATANGSIHGYQWDLSSFVDPINIFEIAFDVASHTAIFSQQLDQSSAVSAQAIPEPSRAILACLGLGSILLRRHRRAAL